MAQITYSCMCVRVCINYTVCHTDGLMVHEAIILCLVVHVKFLGKVRKKIIPGMPLPPAY